jgi:hypothetical protein
LRRLTLALPLALALAYLLAQAWAPAGDVRARFLVAEIAIAKFLALVGCLVAASSYRRGEYLNIAWAVVGIDYGLLFAKDLLFGKVVHLPALSAADAELARAACVIVANIAGAIGSWMMARVWHVAGIALPGSKASQRAALLSGVVIAVAVVGWGAWRDLHQALAGDRESLIGLASDLGDIVSFSLIAPILLTAVAMRGGTVGWSWALITASNLAWLLYDVTWSFERYWHASPLAVRTVAELWRGLGCTLAFSAGLALRWAISQALRARAAGTGPRSIAG